MKTVLLCGVSGGMGLATTKALIQAGYEVVGLDIVPPKEMEHLDFFPSDLADLSSIEEAFAAISKKYKEFDAIIHQAGIYDTDSLVEMEDDSIHKIFDINFYSVVRVNKLFLPLLKKDGRIIITSSELAPLDPLPFTGIYGITKSTLEKYAYSLRMELQLLGYKVIVVRPGAVDTGLLDVSIKRLNRFKNKTMLYKDNALRYERIVSSVESKNIPPEKIARLVLKVLRKKKPKYVYSINRNKLLKLFSLLPKRFQNFAIKSILTKHKD